MVEVFQDPGCFSHVGRAIEKVAEDMPNDPVSIADVGDTTGQQTHRLGDTEASSQRVAGITEKRKGEIVARCKTSVAHRVVAADTPDDGPELLQSAVAVSETAGLHRAARGVVLWVEKKNQTAAVQFIGRTSLPILIGQCERRELISDAERHFKNVVLDQPRNPWGCSEPEN